MGKQNVILKHPVNGSEIVFASQERANQFLAKVAGGNSGTVQTDASNHRSNDRGMLASGIPSGVLLATHGDYTPTNGGMGSVGNDPRRSVKTTVPMAINWTWQDDYKGRHV